MREAVRTVVLAREGAARERVIEGLAEAGADLVGTLDPTVHAPEALEALAPSVLVVVLEPADEDLLDAFEPAFVVDGRTVIFEEAALVLERTGWDAARWVRHLGAKLRGQRDVLPPAATPATAADDTIETDATADTSEAAEIGEAIASPVESHAFDAIDGDPAPAEAAPLTLAPLPLEFDAHSAGDAGTRPDADADADSNAQPVEFGYERKASDAVADDADAAASDAGAHFAFDPVSAEFEPADAPEHAAAPKVEFSFDFELAEYDETGYTPPSTPPVEVRDLDENLAAWSGAADAADEASSNDAPAAADADAAQAATPVPATELTLLDADALPSFRNAASSAEADADTEAVQPAKTLERDLTDLETRISGLSLADTDSYGHGPVRGVVLIAGGLGGPDAVRQLLGALPEGFPRPVLVRLQLDGGRYDRLVRQMERATAMPVQLAEAGMTMSPGEVYFLPPGLLPEAAGGALRFAEIDDVAALADAVPADDSALLFLSGADPSLVDVAMGPAWQGALVGGQSEDNCYDPAAARAVAERGGPSGTPVDIADWLIARWMPSARRFDSGDLSL
ncbi:hypothetical protein CMZ84_11865 [Lysobacteraceae bacterium NML93-0399]|nr:hypothetical protein CMZ84_11865 [Xanthomonadaceae bacterium NML93-0399]